MGEAMIAALLKTGASAPERIFFHDIQNGRAETLKKKYGITPLADNTEVIHTCDVVIFAVKPQSLDRVLSTLHRQAAFGGITDRKRIISIIAGKPLSVFEKTIYAGLNHEQKTMIPILRVMPNTPALVGAGMSGLCANAYADAGDMETAKKLLQPMGRVLEIEEKFMDAITAMSGSGPAYCFYFVEAMIHAGVSLGFSKETAVQLTTATFQGALAMLSQLNESPEKLRQNVTSPGGTTEAAVSVLEEKGVKDAIIQAIRAAARRSFELSQS